VRIVIPAVLATLFIRPLFRITLAYAAAGRESWFSPFSTGNRHHLYSPSREGYEAQVNDRLTRWRAAHEMALGLEQTETLPDLSEAEVLDIQRRTGRRGEGP
jgi:hypothetical protein